MSAGAYILHTSSLSTIAGTGEEEQEASHLHLLDPFAPLLDTLPSSLRLCLDKYPSTVPWGRTHAARQNKQQAAEPSSSSAATSSSRPRKRARTRRRETQQTDVYEELIERAAQRLKEHAQANLGALDWWENTALASGRVRFSYEGEHISTEHSGIEWAILEREHDDLLVGAQVIKQKSPALSVNSQQSLLLGLTEQDRKGEFFSVLH